MRIGKKPSTNANKRIIRALSPVMSKRSPMLDEINETPSPYKNIITADDLKKGKPLSLTCKRNAFLYDHSEVLHLINSKKKKTTKCIEPSKTDQMDKLKVISCLHVFNIIL
jgi:hypothetical protein